MMPPPAGAADEAGEHEELDVGASEIARPAQIVQVEQSARFALLLKVARWQARLR
jgi:hypothetical protein